MKLVFFQHHHNGDVFTAKEFLRQVRTELPDIEIEVLHFNHPKILEDVEIHYGGKPENLDQFERFKISDDTMFINFWTGCYDEAANPNNPPYFWQGGINLETLTGVWGYIFEHINTYFNTGIQLKSKEHYIPEINFNFFDTDGIDNLVKTNHQKKVLICNGKAMSGQSFKSDMTPTIDELSKKYPEILFICTQRTNLNRDNIIYTEDVISVNSGTFDPPFWVAHNKCDLNEISYLGKFCDVIVGKNSGPFIFCLTKENLALDKTFISFNKRESDTFIRGISTTSTYVYSNEFDNVTHVIEKYL